MSREEFEKYKWGRDTKGRPIAGPNVGKEGPLEAEKELVEMKDDDTAEVELPSARAGNSEKPGFFDRFKKKSDVKEAKLEPKEDGKI